MRVTVEIEDKKLRQMMKLTREKRKGRAIAKLAEESLNLQMRRRILEGMFEKGKGIDFEEYDPWKFERRL